MFTIFIISIIVIVFLTIWAIRMSIFDDDDDRDDYRDDYDDRLDTIYQSYRPDPEPEPDPQAAQDLIQAMIDRRNDPDAPQPIGYVEAPTAEDVQDLVKSTLENFKGIHVLVNNAGITRRKLLLELTEEDWDVVQDINLKGVFNCTQAVLGHMMEQRYGKIINISSIGGYGVPHLNMANYESAKAGVIQLTRITAWEAGPYGINVNCIAPGGVVTELQYTIKNKEGAEIFWEESKRRAVLGRLGKPEDVANLALFLVSDDSN